MLGIQTEEGSKRFPEKILFLWTECQIKEEVREIRKSRKEEIVSDDPKPLVDLVDDLLDRGKLLRLTPSPLSLDPHLMRRTRTCQTYLPDRVSGKIDWVQEKCGRYDRQYL